MGTGGWYTQPVLETGNSWRGFETQDYVGASESAFLDLNLTFDQIFLPFEDTQASERAWIKSDAPLNLWNIEDESASALPDNWYIEPESTLDFYTLGLNVFAGFYGEQTEPQFYWTIEPDPQLFYNTVTETQFYWIIESAAPADRFYLTSMEDSLFYWVVITEIDC